MGSVRLDPALEEQVRRVAQRKGMPLSQVHRLALERFCEQGMKRSARAVTATPSGWARETPTCPHAPKKSSGKSWTASMADEIIDRLTSSPPYRMTGKKAFTILSP